MKMAKLYQHAIAFITFRHTRFLPKPAIDIFLNIFEQTIFSAGGVVAVILKEPLNCILLFLYFNNFCLQFVDDELFF